MNPISNPDEQIEHISDVLKQKQEENIACYYTIAVERFGAFTKISDRKSGAENFVTDVRKAIEAYNPDKVVVELWNGHTAKGSSETSFILNIKEYKQHLYGLNSTATPVKSEAFTDPETHYREKLELHRMGWVAELDNRILLMKVEQKDKEIEELKGTIEEQGNYIEELEEQAQKPTQYTGLGGINLLEAGSLMLERFIQRNPQILKTALNLSDEQLAGLFVNGAPEQKQVAAPQGNATASVASVTSRNETEEQKIIRETVERLTAFLSSLPGPLLGKVYAILGHIQERPKLADEILEHLKK